jgi:AraC-like DNA-binding protein
MSDSRYCELVPPAALADRLVCLWTLSTDKVGDEAEYLQPVLPDGCVDIVWIGQAEPRVAGPATRPVLVALPVGIDIIGIRFKPGWAAACLGLPASELINLDVPLADIWGDDAERLSEWIMNKAAPQDAVTALTLRLQQVAAPDPATVAAVRWLARHPLGRVQQLARLLDLSERQLQRRLIATVGYGPKTLQRILRLQRLLALSRTTLIKPGQPDLATLALSAGYADQAHMSRDVRTLAGKTPQTLLRNAGSTLTMSDLFNTAASDSHYHKPFEHII